MTDLEQRYVADGYCHIDCDNCWYRVPLADYEHIEHVVTSGQTWVEFTTLLGVGIKLRTEKINYISCVTPEVAQACRVNDDQVAAQEKLS